MEACANLSQDFREPSRQFSDSQEFMDLLRLSEDRFSVGLELVEELLVDSMGIFPEKSFLDGRKTPSRCIYINVKFNSAPAMVVL